MMIWVRISYERQRNPQCITTTAKNNTLAQIRIRITCYINHLLNFLPCLLTVACCFLAFLRSLNITRSSLQRHVITAMDDLMRFSSSDDAGPAATVYEDTNALQWSEVQSTDCV